MLGQASKLCTPHSAPHAPALHRRPPLSPGRLPVGRSEREARLHWLLYTESGATFPHLWLVSSGAQVPSRVGERSFLWSKSRSLRLGRQSSHTQLFLPVSSMSVQPLQLTQEEPGKCRHTSRGALAASPGPGGRGRVAGVAAGLHWDQRPRFHV